ncbi:MAG: helix-hairpin-helix domain-containing protein [Acidobacteriota bacterium]
MTRLVVHCLALCLLVGGGSSALAQGKEPSTKEPSKTATKAVKKPEKPVDINTASEKELLSLPGVGPKLAKSIAASRPYQSIEDLKKVKGIGEKNFAAMKDYLVCSPAKK